MITRAVLKYVRITPRKFRLIIPFIKGKNPEEALAILASVKKNASIYGIELLKSVIAAAKRKQGVDVADLYISKLVADPGPMLKRFRAASMGRASMIKKRTSHLTLELDEIKKPGQEAAGKKEKKEAKPAAHHEATREIPKAKQARRLNRLKKAKG